ncbi:DUF2470 domain-containing protein [Hoeflea sp. CAU 1731]
MAETKATILETDEQARALATRLVRTARFGALAVLHADTGAPFASRVAVATACDGVPVILVSRLSEHTSGLLSDPRSSLLVGEPGKGDPLAYPRISLVCSAVRIDRDDPRHASVRSRFLRRHPKSALYADFADFLFFRLEPLSASLNGGFGKAYRLAPEDIRIDSPANEELAGMEERAVEHMNEDHPDAVDLYAKALAGESGNGWKLATVDAAGFDMIRSERVSRVEFNPILTTAAQLRPELVTLAQKARKTMDNQREHDGSN